MKITSTYVRGGSFADTCYWGEVNEKNQLIAKTDGADRTRNILLKIELSDEDLSSFAVVRLRLTAASFHPTLSGNKLYMNVYEVDSNWDPETVTYATAPHYGENNYIGRGFFGCIGPVLTDITDSVVTARKEGRKVISLLVSPSEVTDTEVKFYAEGGFFPPALMFVKNDFEGAYCRNLTEDAEKNREIWAKAEGFFADWLPTYEELKAKGNAEVRPISTVKEDYSFEVTASMPDQGGREYTFPSRRVDTLVGFEAKDVKKDIYGARDEGGRYGKGGWRTEKIGGRYYLIDPLGNPTYLTGINMVQYAYKNSEYQTAAMKRLYGTPEAWAKETTRWLRDDLAYNAGCSMDISMLGVEGTPLPAIRNLSFLRRYAATHGLDASTGGPARFKQNNTLPVFDDEFVSFADEYAKAELGKWDLSKHLGFATDNELPTGDTLFAAYLMLDYTNEQNFLSYAAAWTFYKKMTGESDPRVEDIDEWSKKLGVDLFDLFKGFVYDRYYRVVKPAFKKYAPNNLFLGIRTLSHGGKREWMLRAAGRHVDIFCINYYRVWEIDADYLTDMARWLDRPILITEFYAKAKNAIASDGKPFSNHMGAGWLVENQTERGYFYQNYTLRLLECPACVGWLYFQYLDNDPTAKNTERGQMYANKGIVNNDLDEHIYADYTSQMALVNQNVYSLIDFFDHRK